MNAKLTPRSNLAARIVDYSDRYLRIREIPDWPNALNGLQLQNSGRVKRIGAAVDASTRVLTAAAKQRVDFLLVHHGLFWAGLGAVTGALHRQLEIAFSHDIAVYSAHLPLDVHPVVGNNTRLCAALGMRSAKPFLQIKGNPAGLRARSALSLAALATKLSASVNGPVRTFHFGPKHAGVVGVVTGAAGSEIHRVATEGVDTFITGEAPHWAAVAAEELGINLLVAGHYATETFGVKALAAHLSKRFAVPWSFIHCPTGM